MPDVKSITQKKLDQKLREAHIEPQQVDPIRGDTIPPYYSRELGKPKPPRDPRPPRTPKTETKEEQSSAKVCPKCKGEP